MKLNYILCGILTLFTITLLVLAFYSYKRKRVSGAKYLSYLCVASSIYVFGYSMELVAPSLLAMDFWSKFQYIGLPFIPSLWVIMSLDFTHNLNDKILKKVNILLFISFLTFVFRQTSSILDFHYSSISMGYNGYFSILEFGKGPWYYIHFLFFVCCSIYASYIYFGYYKKTNLYKTSTKIMMIASVLPPFSFIINSSSINSLSIDIGPFFIFFLYVLFYVGLFRYNMFNLLPIAKNNIFDTLADGVLIIDMDDRLVEYNIASQKIFKGLNENSLDQNLREVFTNYRDFLKKIEKNINDSNLKDFEFKITNIEENMVKHYQAKISEIKSRNYLIGKSIIIHDTSKHYDDISKLEHLANIDSLTGIYNRRRFLERLVYEIKRAERKRSPFSIVLFDLDMFKTINDTYGHSVGDIVLVEIADLTGKNLRNIDILARYGGEEFIIFLPDSRKEDAKLVSTRLRAAFESHGIKIEDMELHITASFGIATYNYDEILSSENEGDENEEDDIKEASHTNLNDEEIEGLIESLIDDADKAMYKAKRLGRNKVCTK